jgi:hypothetical protein
VAPRWWSLIVEGRLEEVAGARTLIRRGVLDPEQAKATVAYITAGAPKLHAASRLRDPGATSDLCSRGSGAIEHNVDLVVTRRLKRRGMTWTREGYPTEPPWPMGHGPHLEDTLISHSPRRLCRRRSEGVHAPSSDVRGSG